MTSLFSATPHAAGDHRVFTHPQHDSVHKSKIQAYNIFVFHVNASKSKELLKMYATDTILVLNRSLDLPNYMSPYMAAALVFPFCGHFSVIILHYLTVQFRLD